ncbi:MAG: Tex-like N-terminal domain-containing protein, partial [Lachnospiraceae bacterium]
MEINKKIAEELGVGLTQVNAAVRLIDEGCTIPFIARYRKEATGALNDEQLRALAQRLSALKNLEERREKVLLSIEEQGKLTEKLREAILAAETAVALDDIYRPYRPKRSTRATAAAERGLTGLADIIWAQRTERSLEEEAHAYISAEKGVNSTEEAIAGACDILSERFAY